MDRRWYLVALALALVGAGGAYLFFSMRLQSVDAALTRMIAPGEVEITLQPGSYTLFHEFRSVLNGRYYESDDVSGLNLHINSSNGEPIALRGGANANYEIAGHAGVSVADFDIDEPGTYTFVSAYNRRNGPEAVLAVGQGVIGRIFALVLGTIAIAFAGVGSGIAIASITYVKRRRATEAKS
ncbi:MAG: hypothetical protein ACLQJR_15015 [Stellaceae bacterium]